VTFSRSLHDAALVLARSLTSVIFVTSGVAKIGAWNSNIAYMANRSLPFVPLLLAIALFIELGGAACVVAGFQTRKAAGIMFVYMIFVTAILHRFGSTDYQKNLGIMGALLMLAVCGAGGWTLGAARLKRTL
jgi:putative oxidoreductase